MPFIYSTLTCANDFAVYAQNDAKAPGIVLKTIHIKGGHGLKNPKGLETPNGVVTEVTEEELELLLKDFSFNEQVKAGFLTVDAKEVAPAKKVVDMTKKDGSAPLTPDDYDVSDNHTAETPIYKKKGK